MVALCGSVNSADVSEGVLDLGYGVLLVNRQTVRIQTDVLSHIFTLELPDKQKVLSPITHVRCRRDVKSDRSASISLTGRESGANVTRSTQTLTVTKRPNTDFKNTRTVRDPVLDYETIYLTAIVGIEVWRQCNVRGFVETGLS